MNLSEKTETAIIILGGGLIKDGNKWRTTNFEEKGDEFGALGDRLRVLAGSYLFKDIQGSKIICSGGKGQLKDCKDAPTVAEVLHNELVELDIPDGDIIKEEISGNTFEQLAGALKIIEEKKYERVMIISNEYHLPRIKTIIENFPELRKGFSSFNLELESAEKILVNRDSENWKEAIKKAYKSDNMKKRIKLEEQGVRNIREKRYKIR
jgi:hypothetical protein